MNNPPDTQPIVNLWQPPQSPGLPYKGVPATPVSSTPEQYPIIDGLMYNPLLRYLPVRYLPLAYERLKKFRTGSWQPRLYVVPEGNGGLVINAGTTLSRQIRTAVSGCELIGYTLGTLTDTPADLAVVIVDADATTPCSSDAGYPFANGIDRYIVGSAYAAAAYTGASGVSGQRFVLLSKPYVIANDILTVKIANLSVTDDIQSQLVLYIMEPFS